MSRGADRPARVQLGDAGVKRWLQTRLRPALAVLAALVLTILSAGPSFAQTSEQPSSQATIRKWEKTLAEAEAYINADTHTNERHERYRELIAQIILDSRGLGQAIGKDVEATKQLLEALGTPPAEGEGAEPADLSLKRKAFQEEMNTKKAQLAQADLVNARAKALEQTFKDTFRKQVVQALVERYPLPLGGKFYLSLTQLKNSVVAIFNTPLDWYYGLSPAERSRLWSQWQSLLTLVALVAGVLLQRSILRRFGPDPAIREPSYPRRLAAAIAKAIARGVLPAAFLGALYLWSTSEVWRLSGTAADVLANFCRVFGATILCITFPRAVLSPSSSAWRCPPLASDAARTLYRRLVAVTLIFAFHRFYISSALAVNVRYGIEPLPETKTLYAMLFVWLAGPAMLLVTRDSAWRRLPRAAPASAGQGQLAAPDTHGEANDDELLGGRAWRLARRAIAILVIVGMVAATAGFIRFGYYIIDNVIFSAIVFGLLFLLHNAIVASFAYLLRLPPVEKRLQLTEVGRQSVQFWGGLTFDAAFLLIAVFAIAPAWGIPRSILTDWGRRVAEGIALGNVTISIVDILIAVLVFFVGLFITRITKTTLSDRLLPRTGLDYGVRNSITTGAGYIGAIISLLVAVAALGINMSNLAILGGALGVGIGFGLQNIVNNFVSGLIMLVERPIRVGDLVVVGDKQGTVRRISVRATQIETFEGAAVIVPNSEFISSPVVNWTRVDRVARVEVRIGANYGSDPERVLALLLECAKGHPDVVTWPRTNAFFVDFGANSLEFLLLAYVSDVDKRLSVASALRLAINKSFHAAGIEIPFGQVDVHFKDIDRLEAAVLSSRSLKESANQAPTPVADTRETLSTRR